VTCVRIACLYCEKYPFKNKNTKERTLSHTPIKSLPSIFLKKKATLPPFPHQEKQEQSLFLFQSQKHLR
jgi:hypothetical protein